MVMKRKRIVKCLSGCLALLGLTVSCNDELYMGGVGVVPATKAYYLYTVVVRSTSHEGLERGLQLQDRGLFLLLMT